MLSWTDSLRGVTENGHQNNEEQGGSKRQAPCRRHPVRDEEHFRQERGFSVAMALKKGWGNEGMWQMLYRAAFATSRVLSISGRNVEEPHDLGYGSITLYQTLLFGAGINEPIKYRNRNCNLIGKKTNEKRYDQSGLILILIFWDFFLLSHILYRNPHVTIQGKYSRSFTFRCWEGILGSLTVLHYLLLWCAVVQR